MIEKESQREVGFFPNIFVSNRVVIFHLNERAIFRIVALRLFVIQIFFKYVITLDFPDMYLSTVCLLNIWVM